MIVAYNDGSTMARTLEQLDPGTPVFCGNARVGSVASVYAEGDARAAEIVVVRWDATGTDLAVPASEVLSLDADGVHLIRQEPSQYTDFAPFDSARFTTMKKLR